MTNLTSVIIEWRVGLGFAPAIVDNDVSVAMVR